MSDAEYPGLWRDGNFLVVRNRAAKFPPSCVVCNEDRDCRALWCKIRKRPTLLAFLCWWYPIMAPSVLANPFLCPTHRRQELFSRRIGHAIVLAALFIMLASIGLAVTNRMSSDTAEASGFLGTLLLWAWVYYRIFRRRILWGVYIKQHHAWLDDASPTVRDLFPSLPDAPAS